MKALKKKLHDWVAKDLLTTEQSQKILAYEEENEGSSWALMGFLILGAVVIGIGIISLIAANWHLTPPWLKLAGNFSFHFFLVFLGFKFWREEKWGYFELVLVLIFMLSLASIGLISQIFHTGGKLYQALQFWSIITFGLFLLSRHKFLPYLWAFTFFGTLSFSLFEAQWLREIFYKSEPSLFLLLPLISFMSAVLFRHLAGDTIQTKALRFTAVLMGCCSILFMEQVTKFIRLDSLDYNLTAYLPSYILGLLALLSISFNKNYKSVQKVLLASILAIYFLPLHLSHFFYVASFLMSFISISFFIALALFMITIQERRLFSVFINIVGLRFLFLYFQAFGGLAYTGFGLIISGVLMISAVILWKKNLKKITAWAERVMQ
jgi:uncharacterized membrane protein